MTAKNNYDVPLIENSEEHSVCEIENDSLIEHKRLDAVTAVDFLQGSMPLVYKHREPKRTVYFSILTDSVLIQFISTKQNTIGE